MAQNYGRRAGANGVGKTKIRSGGTTVRTGHTAPKRVKNGKGK